MSRISLITPEQFTDLASKRSDPPHPRKKALPGKKSGPVPLTSSVWRARAAPQVQRAVTVEASRADLKISVKEVM